MNSKARRKRIAELKDTIPVLEIRLKTIKNLIREFEAELKELESTKPVKPKKEIAEDI